MLSTNRPSRWAAATAWFCVGPAAVLDGADTSGLPHGRPVGGAPPHGADAFVYVYRGVCSSPPWRTTTAWAKA